MTKLRASIYLALITFAIGLVFALLIIFIIALISHAAFGPSGLGAVFLFNNGGHYESS
jgi:hypothetical protein